MRCSAYDILELPWPAAQRILAETSVRLLIEPELCQEVEGLHAHLEEVDMLQRFASAAEVQETAYTAAAGWLEAT
jgi:hypothetical protein